MKSLPTSIFLVVTAVMQAMGIFRYSDDTMAVSGQIFFPILFALMSFYIVLRTKTSDRFSLVHLIILILAGITFALTLTGSIGKLYYFYPSAIVYYVALVLLVIDVAFRIAGMPKAEKKPRLVKKQRKAAARNTNLVAKAKTGSSASSNQLESNEK